MTGSLAFIIEDDPQNNQIFTITLKNNFSVEAFTDGDSARVRLQESIPDLIVLDLNLPGTSGRELLRDIHVDPRLTKTRIILATADDRQAEVVRDQADVVLLKPISPGLLRDLAERLNAPKRRTSG
ncbi:MAG: response regulator [Chloroflexi bacterium]|nr:response regulator [Chloroflexota bacterium]